MRIPAAYRIDTDRVLIERNAADALRTDLMSLQPAHPNPARDAISLKQAITLNRIQYRHPSAPQRQRWPVSGPAV